jgi:ribosomal subunit interface protein
MEIIFNGRQTDVPARFREHATAKLHRLEKLDQKAIRVDVEVSVERNPRQSSQKERVELTISSRGPAIRAEAAAEDRFAALDLALAKLNSRVRRALDRRKSRSSGHGEGRHPEAHPEAAGLAREEGGAPLASADGLEPAGAGTARAGTARAGTAGAGTARAAAAGAEGSAAGVVPIQMEGDGPVVVRQKLHRADPISLDQALFEMELVGHDFYLFYDVDQNVPSVVYRRRGYQYGVIRLLGNSVPQGAPVSSAAAAGRSGG